MEKLMYPYPYPYPQPPMRPTPSTGEAMIGGGLLTLALVGVGFLAYRCMQRHTDQVVEEALRKAGSDFRKDAEEAPPKSGTDAGAETAPQGTPA